MKNELNVEKINPEELKTVCPNCGAQPVVPYYGGPWVGINYFCDSCKTYFDVSWDGQISIGDTLED